MNERGIARIESILETLRSFARATRDALWRITRSDTQAIVIIIVLAALLRFPYLSHPDITQFDEVIYTDYALHILNHEPLFDIHPPLARIMFAEAARVSPPESTSLIPLAIGQPFGDFPYVIVRFMVACFGVLLPLVIYGVARALRFDPRIALLPALFVVFDNALVIYSRVILPDTLLLCFSFAALLCALRLIESEQRGKTFAYTLLTGILIGCALSVKWTALGMFGVIILFFISHRRYSAIIATLLYSIFVYLLMFVVFFGYFPQGGKTISPISTLEHPWVRMMDFPAPTLGNILTYLPEYHHAMLAAQSDPYLLAGTLPALGPYSWPAAQSAIQFWSDQGSNPLQPVEMKQGGRYIMMAGNAELWVMVLFAFIWSLAWIFLRSVSTRTLPIKKDELLLIIGYLANFVPFFFIHRSMYLYHYFTALLFLFLLVPYTLPRIRHCLELITHDRWFSYVFIATALMLVVINFVINMPMTYGFLW